MRFPKCVLTEQMVSFCNNYIRSHKFIQKKFLMNEKNTEFILGTEDSAV